MDERELEDAMKTLAGAITGAPEEWTVASAFEQIEACQFECEAGSIENNIAYRWLKDQAL